jgi:glutamate--cysteine ligase
MVGLEKESLRVNSEGKIAQTPHPQSLGSALTHPYITTDYSEALLEFITPPFHAIGEALDFLRDLQQYVYNRLDKEVLWATSMPCVVAGESSIPIAAYGSSNAGMMKTIYRRGLGYRYGRAMQVIAGVHFNYSYSDAFWQALQQLEGDDQPLQEYISERYFDLLRNLLRIGWLIPYLFGASPAVCKSFLNGKASNLDSFDDYTFYEPYATSLRMGDIGYQNNKENETGIKANYSSLDAYVDSLTRAISTPCPEYQRIGVKVDGEYRQLNANILQIENEYYSTVRPKQLLRGNEKPSLALRQRGVRYIELRSLDINAFDPLGINEAQLHFLEALLLYCLFADSPPISAVERVEIDQNEMRVAHRGREPGLNLMRCGSAVALKQ